MNDTDALARRVLDACRESGLMVATAESCTGGLVAAALTDIAGSSDVFDRGFVTYSNAAKTDMLGVAAATIATHGAVSAETAIAMADGALACSQASLVVSITGIAGPGGGSDEKPVGLVWFGLAASGRKTVAHERRFGDAGRAEVREKACAFALQLLLDGAGG